MSELFNPNLDDAKRLNEMKKYLISQSRTFCCPVTKELLDYRSSHIVKFKLGDKEKVDIVSHKGWKKIPDDMKRNAAMRVIEDWQEL